MAARRYCRCCYSTDLLEKLCGTELGVYSLICNTQDPKDSHAEIVACLRCREFLEDVRRFRIERCGIDEKSLNNLAIKRHEEFVEFERDIDIQINEVEVDYDPENFPESTTSQESRLASNMVNTTGENLLTELYHDQEMSSKPNDTDSTENDETVLRNQKQFSCDICNSNYKSKGSLSTHMKSHLNDCDKPHKCSECSYTAISIWCLNLHIARKHSNEKPFSCNMCDYSCKKKQLLSLHIRRHLNDNEKPYKCNECSYTTITNWSLKLHISRKHSDEKPFICNICGYRCKSKQPLLLHTKTHLNESDKPYECSQCSYRTITTWKLKHHVAIRHTDVKLFECDQCSFRTKTKRQLSIHMSRHLSGCEKAFKCSECSFTTVTSDKLKRHAVFRHSNEKPFSCDQCDYHGKMKSQLSTHKRIHLNDSEKPYKCSECSFTTTASSYLKTHFAYKHSDEKPFPCDQCDYRGKRRFDINQHKKTHLANKKDGD